MPLPRITEDQFAGQIANEIALRDDAADTSFGPIRDWSIGPQASVLAQQSETARTQSLQLSVDPTAFSEGSSDLADIVFNEGIIPPQGEQSTATLTFFRNTAPTVDLPVQRGFPVASTPDSNGAAITYVTTESVTLPVATASSYFNLDRNRWELSVAAIATTPGSAGRVGPNRIKRALRPMSFDGVTNISSSEGGQDPFTNDELVRLYRLSIRGRQTGTPGGIERAVLADFPGVRDVATVYGTNVLLVRAATDAGAVDAYILGESVVQTVENATFYGVGVLITPTLQPLREIVTVTSGANTYNEGTDYELVVDDLAGSTRSASGFIFLSTTGGTALPAIGASVTITYTYNSLIRQLQTDASDADNVELGRDLLYREGLEVPMVHSADLKVKANFSQTAVLANVRLAVLNFFNETLGLGGDGGSVQESDIQAVVRALSGVDNYITTRLTRSTELTGTSDVPLGENEFPTLASADLAISLV